MSSSKVYVVAKGDHVYDKAGLRGELVFLYPGKVNVFASDRLLREVKEKLADSSPDDFVILSGSMLAAAIAFAVMLHKHGHVNVLIYSFKKDEYEVRTTRLSHIESALEVIE